MDLPGDAPVVEEGFPWTNLQAIRAAHLGIVLTSASLTVYGLVTLVRG